MTLFVVYSQMCVEHGVNVVWILCSMDGWSNQVPDLVDVALLLYAL